MNFKPPLESKIEADFLKLLKKHPAGFLVRKLNGIGYRSWPDRWVLGPKGFQVLIEFKRPILGKLSPGQTELFGQLDKMGHKVWVFDNAQAAYDFVEASYRLWLGLKK